MANAAIIAGQWNMIVGHDLFELGDLAANALKIERAGEFAEIHGHYSRWGFWHPGPAFFYVYAAAEWLFNDLMRWTASPHTAHRVGGMLLQNAFLVWGLVIVGNWVRRSGFIWLGTLASLIYLACLWEPTSLMNIWPPYTLIVPYFLMIIAAVSFSCGRDRDMVPAVIAGCFLVHGHIAQPLFVGVTLGYAVLLRLLREKSFSWIPSPYTGRSAIVLIVIAAFAVPPIIDVVQNHGNAGRILNFLTYREFSQNDWSDVARSLAALGMLTTNDHWTPALALGRQTAGGSIKWLGPLAWAPGAVWAFLAFARPLDSRWSWFVRRCALFFVVEVLLLTWWIRSQMGEPYLFNNLFAYGVLLMGTILMVAEMSQWRIWKSYFALPATVTLLILINVAIHLETRENISLNTGYRDFVRQETLNRDIPGVYLEFDHDDWPYAVTAALALKRNDIRFLVDRKWRIMFGEENILQPDDPRQTDFEHWTVSGTVLRAATGSVEP
jgi:hypothetical protein